MKKLPRYALVSLDRNLVGCIDKIVLRTSKPDYCAAKVSIEVPRDVVDVSQWAKGTTVVILPKRTFDELSD